MATNKKTSEITEISALATSDKFFVYDASDTSESKSITYSEILSNTDTMTNKTIEFSAGTVSAAPIQLTSGTNLTTPVAGAIEFDGTNFYITI
jgi:hypothetical protein